MGRLNGHIALVTGVSHEKGIGTAICRAFANAGADIFFAFWNAEDSWFETLRGEIINLGVRCEGVGMDLSAPESPYKLLDLVCDKLGTPSILVNNAAHSTRDGYKFLDAKIIDDHYAVNIRATMLLSVEFAKRFQQTNLPMGRIINLTSGQAQGPMPGELAYVATKGAISAFTVSLSAELASLGITVNAINPGPTDSGWMTDEIKRQLLPKFLMGRMGLPEDAARLAAFLASEEAQWITGQIINSEGGFFRY